MSRQFATGGKALKADTVNGGFRRRGRPKRWRSRACMQRSQSGSRKTPVQLMPAAEACNHSGGCRATSPWRHGGAQDRVRAPAVPDGAHLGS